MPFVSMNLSTLASQSSPLVNELQYSSQILEISLSVKQSLSHSVSGSVIK